MINCDQSGALVKLGARGNLNILAILPRGTMLAFMKSDGTARDDGGRMENTAAGCWGLKDDAQKGLYLVFEDSSRLALTRDNIEKTTAEYWNNPAKIPPAVKSALEFQRCPFCPLEGRGDFCDALRPILPLLDVVDRYMSYDKVTAIYKGDDRNLVHAAETTITGALKYLSVISLMQYCHIGRKYWKYYAGIMPLTDVEESSLRMYLNIYWNLKGNQEEIHSLIARFRDQIRMTTDNQVKRLSTICKKDSFVNAFVNAQLDIEFLSLDIEQRLALSFSSQGNGA